MIFFQHGFQGSVARIGHLAKSHSDLGYDFFAMDLRGHGKSGGQISLINSLEETIAENELFHKKVLEKFYKNKNPPIFLMGNSYGCMVGMELLLREKINYKAAHFLGPFYGF